MTNNRLRMIHTGDLHWDGEHLSECVESHAQILEIAKVQKPDAVLIAGDFWNSPQTLSNDGAVAEGLAWLDKLVVQAPVIIIRGNRQHDDVGSVRGLKVIGHANRLYVSEAAESVILFAPDSLEFKGQQWAGDGRRIFPVGEHPPSRTPQALIHLFSYPEKGQWLTDPKHRNLSIDEANAVILQDISNVMLGFATLNAQFPTIPHILVFHGNIDGSKLSNGQRLISQDVIVPVDVLELAGCDYVAAAHIHARQEIRRHIRYCGSTRHKDFGETERKSVELVTFDGQKLTEAQAIPLSSIPLAEHEVRYDRTTNVLVDTLEKDGPLVNDWSGAKLRVKVHILDSESQVVDIETLVHEKYAGAHSYQVKRIRVDETRVRNEEITQVHRLRDKLKVWLEATGRKADPRIFDLADQTENAVH